MKSKNQLIKELNEKIEKQDNMIKYQENVIKEYKKCILANQLFREEILAHEAPVKFVQYRARNTSYLIFKDVKVKEVLLCMDNETGCYDVEMDTGEKMKVKDHFKTTYKNETSLTKLVDNLTIYDKFKTKDSIYEKESKLVDRKFIPSEDALSDSRMELTDKSLIDYDLINIATPNKKAIIDDVYNRLKNEMVKDSDKFKVYNVYGEDDYIGNYNDDIVEYISYRVNIYSMDKDTFEKNKKQIYLSKYDKIKHEDGLYYETDENNNLISYPFLKQNLNEEKFFYYFYVNNKKVDTKSLINIDYLKSIFPSYKGEEILVLKNEKREYKNALVIYIKDGEGITIKMGNDKKVIKNDDSNYIEVKNNLFKWRM